MLLCAYTVERLMLTHCGLFYLLGIRVRWGETDATTLVARKIVVPLLGYARYTCWSQFNLKNFVVSIDVLEVVLLLLSLLLVVEALLGRHLLRIAIVVV